MQGGGKGKDGVDFDIFKENVPVIKYENKDIAERTLATIKEEIKEGQITWNDFLKFLKLILAKTFSEKIDNFFYVSVCLIGLT